MCDLGLDIVIMHAILDSPGLDHVVYKARGCCLKSILTATTTSLKFDLYHSTTMAEDTYYYFCLQLHDKNGRFTGISYFTDQGDSENPMTIPAGWYELFLQIRETEPGAGEYCRNWQVDTSDHYRKPKFYLTNNDKCNACNLSVTSTRGIVEANGPPPPRKLQPCVSDQLINLGYLMLSPGYNVLTVKGDFFVYFVRAPKNPKISDRTFEYWIEVGDVDEPNPVPDSQRYCPPLLAQHLDELPAMYATRP
jgi:hypothetical protein